MKTAIIKLALILSCSATLVFAHSGATGVVKERMDMMGDVASSMKVLNSIIKKDAALDVKAAQGAAQIISNHAHHFPKLFPHGSISGPSEARTEIWKNWEEFEGLFKGMKERSDRLINTIGNASSSGQLRDDFTQLGATCGACHKKFRAKK